MNALAMQVTSTTREISRQWRRYSKQNGEELVTTETGAVSLCHVNECSEFTWAVQYEPLQTFEQYAHNWEHTRRFIHKMKQLSISSINDNGDPWETGQERRDRIFLREEFERKLVTRIAENSEKVTK